MNYLAKALLMLVLCLSAMSIEAAHAASQQAAILNNEGVKQLNAREWVPGD